jgi:hypothetical protein
MSAHLVWLNKKIIIHDVAGLVQVDYRLMDAVKLLLLPALHTFRRPYHPEQVHHWISDFKSWGRFILESSSSSRTIFMDTLANKEIRICFAPHECENIDKTIKEHAFAASFRSLPTELQAEIQGLIPVPIPAEIIPSCSPRICLEQQYSLFRDDERSFYPSISLLEINLKMEKMILAIL